MSMRGAVAGCVVLLSLMGLLAEKTEGHITFFSPKEMMLMKEREGKKDMEHRSEDAQVEEVTIQQVPQMKRDANPKLLEIAVRIPAKQLDQVKEFIHEIVDDDDQKDV